MGDGLVTDLINPINFPHNLDRVWIGVWNTCSITQEV